MKKTLAPLLLAAALSGCTGSSDRPPAPIAPDNPGAAAPSPTALAAGVPSAAPTSVPTADPTSDADDEPPGAPTATPTSTPWGEAPAFKYSAAPKPPPKDLGPDARPLRFTKHVALKNLSELEAAIKGPVDAHGSAVALGSEQREVKTCAEYFKAVDEGLHAENTLDGEYEGSLLRKRCGPLWFLRNAWPSRKSYVQSYRFDVPAPLALLPANFDVEESESATIDRDEAGAQGRTLAQFHPGLVVKKKEATSLTWDDPKGSREATVDIVAWGDIDHDGLEDVLLFQWSRPKVRSMGSYYGYKHLILTRKKENGPLVVNVNPDM